MAPENKKCVKVICWGHAPFAIEETCRGRVFIPDGFCVAMQTFDKCFIETTRVINGKAEYCFSSGVISSDWHSTPSSALLQANERSGNHLHGRAVIITVAHPSLQHEIVQRFEGDLRKQGVRRIKRTSKRVSWGDDQSSPPTPTKYGGWGLNEVNIIPNRYELALLGYLQLNQDDDDNFEVTDNYDEFGFENLQVSSNNDDQDSSKRGRYIEVNEDEIKDKSPLKKEPDQFAPEPVTNCDLWASNHLAEEMKEFDEWLLHNELGI
jgi:hypothetical protein